MQSCFLRNLINTVQTGNTKKVLLLTGLLCNQFPNNPSHFNLFTAWPWWSGTVLLTLLRMFHFGPVLLGENWAKLAEQDWRTSKRKSTKCSLWPPWSPSILHINPTRLACICGCLFCLALFLIRFWLTNPSRCHGADGPSSLRRDGIAPSPSVNGGLFLCPSSGYLLGR